MKALLITIVLTVLILGIVKCNEKDDSGNAQKSHHGNKLQHTPKHIKNLDFLNRNTKRHFKEKSHSEKLRHTKTFTATNRNTKRHYRDNPPSNTQDVIAICPLQCTKNLNVNESSSWVFDLYGNGAIIIFYCSKSNVILVYNSIHHIVAIFDVESGRSVIINIYTSAYLVIIDGVAVYGTSSEITEAIKNGVTYEVFIEIVLTISRQIDLETSITIAIEAILNNDLAGFNGDVELQEEVQISFEILAKVTSSINIVGVKGYEIFIKLFGVFNSDVSAVFAASIVGLVQGASQITTNFSQVLLFKLAFVLSLASQITAGVVATIKFAADLSIEAVTTANVIIYMGINGVLKAGGEVIGSIGDLLVNIGGSIVGIGNVFGNIVGGIGDIIGGIGGKISGGFGGLLGV